MPLAMKPIIPLLISVLTGTALTSPALGQSSDLPQSSEQTTPPFILAPPQRLRLSAPTPRLYRATHSALATGRNGDSNA